MASKNSKNKEGKSRSKAIDKQLKLDSLQASNEVKLLLLGAGESGKSTIVKQMKILHEHGYPTDERLSFRPLIFNNTIESLIAILRAMPKLKINLHDQDRLNDVVKLFDTSDDVEELTQELTSIMKRLWHDSGVKNCYSRAREYQLNDSTA